MKWDGGRVVTGKFERRKVSIEVQSSTIKIIVYLTRNANCTRYIHLPFQFSGRGIYLLKHCSHLYNVLQNYPHSSVHCINTERFNTSTEAAMKRLLLRNGVLLYFVHQALRNNHDRNKWQLSDLLSISIKRVSRLGGARITLKWNTARVWMLFAHKNAAQNVRYLTVSVRHPFNAFTWVNNGFERSVLCIKVLCTE